MNETMIRRCGRVLHQMGAARSQQAGEFVAKHLLKEMRSATGPMVQAGADDIAPYIDRPSEYQKIVEQVCDVWDAMIDAALKEGAP